MSNPAGPPLLPPAPRTGVKTAVVLAIVGTVVSLLGLSSVCCCGLGLIARGTPEPKATPIANVATSSQRSPKAADVGTEKKAAPDLGLDFSLAKGRVSMHSFLQHLERRERLKINTPEEGNEIDGTPFQIIGEELGEPCRIHIGGREAFGQNVSAILFEATEHKEVAAVVLGTPFDMTQAVERGNDINSLIDFVDTILPEVDLRELLSTQGTRMSFGKGTSKVFGKATLVISYNRTGKEMMVTITVAGHSKQPVVETKNDTGGLVTLEKRLAGTTWINTRQVQFEWTSDGRFRHNGNEVPWKVIDDHRVEVTLQPDRIDTLIFNQSFTEFKQLLKGGPDSYEGKRTDR